MRVSGTLLCLLILAAIVTAHSFASGAGVLGHGPLKLYWNVTLPLIATAWAHGTSRPASPIPIQHCGVITLAWAPVSILYYLTWERGVAPLIAATCLIVAYVAPIIFFVLGRSLAPFR